MTLKVSLMGGLGNQLFQLSLGLFLAQQSPVILNPILGNCRRNHFGRPDISSFQLPPYVRIEEEPRFNNRVLTALMSRALRASTTNRWDLYVSAVERLLPPVLGSSVTSLHFGRGVSDHFRKAVSANPLYIGYFQTHLTSSDPRIFRELMELKPLQFHRSLDDLIAHLRETRAIMLHVRLTDYLGENSFGVPGKKYYEMAIQKLDEIIGESEIWVFSDDSSRVFDHLPRQFLDRYKLAPSFEETELNFELMRHFSGYIIANSTFSWWAARLRRLQTAPVVYPWPWFKSSSHKQNDFFASDWLSLDSGFGQSLSSSR